VTAAPPEACAPSPSGAVPTRDSRSGDGRFHRSVLHGSSSRRRRLRTCWHAGPRVRDCGDRAWPWCGRFWCSGVRGRSPAALYRHDATDRSSERLWRSRRLHDGDLASVTGNGSLERRWRGLRMRA
jgi:hypothetical protein